MAPYSCGPIQVLSYIVMAIYSYGPHIVMALYSYAKHSARGSSWPTQGSKPLANDGWVSKKKSTRRIHVSALAIQPAMPTLQPSDAVMRCLQSLHRGHRYWPVRHGWSRRRGACSHEPRALALANAYDLIKNRPSLVRPDERDPRARPYEYGPIANPDSMAPTSDPKSMARLLIPIVLPYE